MKLWSGIKMPSNCPSISLDLCRSAYLSVWCLQPPTSMAATILLLLPTWMDHGWIDGWMKISHQSFSIISVFHSTAVLLLKLRPGCADFNDLTRYGFGAFSLTYTCDGTIALQARETIFGILLLSYDLQWKDWHSSWLNGEKSTRVNAPRLNPSQAGW